MTDGDTDVGDLPPSCKFVLDVIRQEGPLSRPALIERTDLPERTVSDALDTLENCGYILRARDSEDLRVVVCNIRSDAHIHD